MKTAFLLIVVACVAVSWAQDTYDVVVVGSGLSGLTSAYELSKKGHSVLILEANEDTGGRTKSLYNISIGGTYVPPNNNNILNLADELGIRPRLMSNSVQKIPDSLFYDSSLAESVYQMIEEIVQASPDQSAVFSHPKATELDRYNIIEWIAMQNCSEEAKTSFFEYYITSENILEEHLPNMSALHAAFFVWTRLRPMSYDWIPTIAWRAISDVDMDLIKGTLQSHFLWRVPQLSFGRTLFPYMFSMWFEGGTGQFAQTLLNATLKLGAELRTSQIVQKVSQEKDYITVTTTQGTTIQAKYAVLAVGPVALSKIQIENRFDNNEPAGHGTPFTGLNVLLFYDSCWWKGQAYGFMVDSKGADPLLGPAPLLPTACIPGDNALRVLSTAVTTANMTDDEIVNKTVEYICSHHPEIRDKILSYKRTLVWNWPKHNPQITPGFVYTPGYLTKYGKYFLKPHHRVYISGSERSIKGMNWLEGAVTSGLTVAGDIHKAL